MQPVPSKALLQVSFLSRHHSSKVTFLPFNPRHVNNDFSTMSWMDSWSRPSKQSAIPPPLYLTSDNVKYCSTCGRVIGARRSHQKNKVVKYCSDGCRNHRPGPLDRKIDRTILALLLDEKDSGLEMTDAKSRFKKGDKRLLITCNEIERIVFKRDIPATEDQADDVDDADADADADSEDGGAAADDPAQHASDHEAISADEAGDMSGHEDANRVSEDGPSLDDRRQEGQRRADEREKVRRAARRAVVFGFPGIPIEQPQAKAKGKRSNNNEEAAEEVPNRKCEALLNGRLVEPSFAKGNWAIRWRE